MIDTKTISAFSGLKGMHSFIYNGERELDIRFPQETTIIDESDLVKMGYTITVPKKASQEIDKKIKDYSKYRDVYQMLIAEISGAQVFNGNIALRGTSRTSMTNNPPPLFIVDDTVVSSIDFIQPNEVANLEVLRDESASFYGLRGAGGVIIIKLKK